MATVTAAELSLEKTLEELIKEYNNLRSDVSAATLAGLITAAGSTIVFEGATEDAYETTLAVVDPTADRTVTFPNVTGTVLTTGNADAGATTTTFADLDHFLINDGGTLKKMALSTALSSLPALIPASANVNALGSAALEWSDLFLGDGSIISFGNDQDVTLTHVADTGLTLNLMMAATTFEPSADTAAGDNAAIGYTSVEGLILTGQGSTSDITLKNDADGTVFTVPTGTDDILFPDSAKAMFGAGSDLQIFHDGSNSYIQDTGTGNLFIEGSLVQIRNSGGTEAMASFTPDGAVSLHYNNAVKLATVSTGVTMTGEVTATGFTGTLDGVLGGGTPAAATVTTLTASGIIKTDDTTAATSTTDGSLQTDGGLSVAADAVIGDDLFLLSDAAVLTFGADKDVTVTHVADAGIMINAAMQLRFRDSAISIGSPADGDLDINADDEIELNSTLIDVNGNLDVSGTGVIAGAVTTAALTASGIIKTDDTTAATSTTDGSLQTDGGLSVTLDAVIGDDLFMLSDAAVVTFGADKDVTLTHVHDTGILLNSTNVIQFNDASQNIGAPTNAILDINATDEIELNATLVDINANVEISGNLTVAGTTITVDTVTMNAQNAVIFEGATANDFETTLTITDPTADRTITLPDVTGTVALTSSNITGSAATVTGAAQTAITSLGTLSALTIQAPTWAANCLTLQSSTSASTDHTGIQFVNAGTNTADIYTDETGNWSVTTNNNIYLKTGSAGISGGTARLTVFAAGGTQIHGALTQTGVATFAARPVFSASITVQNGGQIGSAGDLDAIAIASNGVVTFSQIPVMPANSIDSDEYIDGSIDTAHIADDQITEAKMANDAIGSAELKTLSTLLIKNAAGSTLKTLHGAGA
jgi:hypothetical protein